MSRLPRQPRPNRVGSSAVNMTTSSERLGLNPARFRAASASKAPSTPTTPSYLPAFGIASVWEPEPTAGRPGSLPSHRAKMLPTGSSRTARPASRAALRTYSLPRMSASEKSTRVTTGAGASEIRASSSIRRPSPAPSIVILRSGFEVLKALAGSRPCSRGTVPGPFPSPRTTGRSRAPSRSRRRPARDTTSPRGGRRPAPESMTSPCSMMCTSTKGRWPPGW